MKPPITTDMTIIGGHVTTDLQVATLAQHLDFLVINTVISLLFLMTNWKKGTATSHAASTEARRTLAPDGGESFLTKLITAIPLTYFKILHNQHNQHS